jgi:hypothetical protein
MNARDGQQKQSMLRQLRRRLIWSLWCDVRYRDGQRSENTQRLATKARALREQLTQTEKTTA